MAYYTKFAREQKKGDYQPDRKDINLAHSLQSSNPGAGHGEILTIQGRQFRAINKDDGDGPGRAQFERYFSKDHEVNQQQKGQIAALQKQIAELQKKGSAQAPAAKPKGDQQIDPVTHSPEISGAQKIANDYMSSLNNKKSPWAQAQNDVNASATFNSGGKSSSAPDAQDFADKYKLNLISSGATQQNNTDFTSGGESHLTSAEIFKRDRQLYG